MSRGHGSVQRSILAAFAADPDNAFLLSELCRKVYRVERVDNKHRNAVARAAKAISSLACMHRDTLGGELVFYDPLRVLSYAMARLKSDSLRRYRNNDARWFVPRRKWFREAMGLKKGYRYQRRQTSEADLRALLMESGEYHHHTVPGGVWWRDTELHKARARGDQEAIARLEAEQEAALAELVERWKSSRKP
jgi:hypothetical protein